MAFSKGKVYLAGAITHDVDPRTWRQGATALLLASHWEALDPLAWEAKDFSDADIVKLDYKLILESKAVIVMAEVPSWGTAMELAFAKAHGIPVFAFKAPARMSPWLRYHTYGSAHNLRAAIQLLNDWYKYED